MTFNTILAFVSVLIIKNVLGGVCPPASHIYPCTCTSTTIDCSSDKDFDLGIVFEAITSGKQPNSKDLEFDTFILYNAKISKLEDRVFKGVTFDTILILNCQQLTCVSPNAFNGSEKKLAHFIANGTSFKSDDKDCNIFEALKILYNLKKIYITMSQITEIPENAFEGKIGDLRSVKMIVLNGGQGGHITKVGKKAFSTLKNLEYIDLAYNKIKTIEMLGFLFVDPIRQKLVIDLSHNNLTQNSFGVGAFEVNQRITELRLRANPKLLVLSEAVFEPFLVNGLNETYNNVIDLGGTPLQCSPGNSWLLTMESPLNLINKLKDVMSTNGDSFWKHTKKECSSAKVVSL